MKKNNLEDLEAEAFARGLKIKGYKFSHIANESGLPPKVAMLASAKKKRMGLTPGVPDYMIILKTGGLLFLELKRSLTPSDYRKDGKLKSSAPMPTPEQSEWLVALASIDNIEAVVAHGAKKAIEIVEHYDYIVNKLD